MAFFNQFVDKGLLDRLQPRHDVRLRPRHLHRGRRSFSSSTTTSSTTRSSGAATCRPSMSAISPSRSSSSPVFVTDYPKEIKAFYMKLNDDGKTVAAMDCLVPGIGEIIGGSQREDNYDTLLARMNELGLKPEDYGFYLDLRKYGSDPPRGLRPRLRALRHVPHGHLQHPRRAPVPANRRQLRALICFPKPEDSLSSGFSFRRDGRGFPSFGSTNSPKIFIKPGFFCGRTEASAPTGFPKIFCFCAGEVRQKSGRCGHTSRVEGR